MLVYTFSLLEEIFKKIVRTFFASSGFIFGNYKLDQQMHHSLSSPKIYTFICKKYKFKEIFDKS